MDYELLNQFKSPVDEAEYRCKLKRELREFDQYYNINELTSELEQQVKRLRRELHWKFAEAI